MIVIQITITLFFVFITTRLNKTRKTVFCPKTSLWNLAQKPLWLPLWRYHNITQYSYKHNIHNNGNQSLFRIIFSFQSLSWFLEFFLFFTVEINLAMRSAALISSSSISTLSIPWKVNYNSIYRNNDVMTNNIFNIYINEI